MGIRGGVIVPMIVSVLAGCSSSSNGDGVPRYLLTNTFLGPDAALVAGALASEPSTALGFTAETDDARARWLLTPLDGGYFRITNLALGEGLSLDIVNDGESSERLRMAETGSLTGQFWQVTPLDNGFCRLTADFLGPERSLDVTVERDVPARPVMRPSGNFTGQFWRMDSVGGGTDPTLASCDGEPAF